MKIQFIASLLVVFLSLAPLASSKAESKPVMEPFIDGPWTQIAGNPDLGKYTSKKQQPVDFGVWQAADGSWQLWSCIRKTKCGGSTRLFYRWEGADLTTPDWKPMGIAMEADPKLGEWPGGMQAPHVVREGGKYHMFYGCWNAICHATSDDGKNFERVIQPNGKTPLFYEGTPEASRARDIMMLRVGDLWYGYYTTHINNQGACYVRTTKDFKNWSDSSVVAFGGISGVTNYTAECPHVITKNGRYYLSRTQDYRIPQTMIYHSSDPAMFGINQDTRYYVNTLPIAAPEFVRHNGQDYVVALNTGLDGIRIAKLGWRPLKKTPVAMKTGK